MCIILLGYERRYMYAGLCGNLWYAICCRYVESIIDFIYSFLVVYGQGQLAFDNRNVMVIRWLSGKYV